MTPDARKAPNETVLGLLQLKGSPDPGENLTRTLEAARDAAAQGARIICTQELFRSQYFCQSEDHENFNLAETIPGPSTLAFQKLAEELKVVVIASLFEKRAPGLYHNSAVVIDADGSLMGVYRKMHIPDDPGFYEKFYFTPGDLGFRTWKTRYARVGTLICWDQWYPEAARLTALRGAEILVYPTAIGWIPSEKSVYGETQHDSWETIQRSHGIANGCYVAAVNRIGHEAPAGGEGIEFWGQSFASDPSGRVIRRASRDQEETLIIPIDLNALDFARTHWPFLRDRRIDHYQELTQRYIDQPPSSSS